MPLRPLQYLGNFGNQLSNFERDHDPAISDHGNPNLTAVESQDGQSFRMPAPQWAPGEFAEWKTAKLTGMPTTYGWNAQRAFNQRKIPAMQGFSSTGMGMNPALMALMRGLR